MNTGDFICKASGIHSNRYTYSNSIYINKSTPILITCSTHGDFSILPSSHLHNVKPSGCPRCNGKLITTEDFIIRAIAIHKGYYDYSKVVYVDAKTDVDIICSKHGPFRQKPYDHLRLRKCGRKPSGCKECGFEKIAAKNKDSLSSFVDKADLVHGGVYDYTNSVYVDSRSKVLILCKIHGEFLQSASHHISGSGCPSCVTHGYICNSYFRDNPNRKDVEAIRYVIKMEIEDEVFYKVGITTTTLAKRFASDLHKIEVIDIFHGTLYECFLDEQRLLGINYINKYIPRHRLAGGNSECLSSVLL